MTLKSNDPLISVASFDPRTSGASLSLSVSSTPFSYRLPATGWKPIGPSSAPRGYRYVDSSLLRGTIRSVTIRRGRLKLSARGSALPPLDSSPADVLVSLDSGLDGSGFARFCMDFLGTTNSTLTRFDARRGGSPAPENCG